MSGLKKLLAGFTGVGTCLYGYYIHHIIQYDQNDQTSRVFNESKSKFDIIKYGSGVPLLVMTRYSNVPNIAIRSCCDYCDKLPIENNLTGPYRTVKHDAVLPAQFESDFIPQSFFKTIQHQKVDVIGSVGFNNNTVDNIDYNNIESIKRMINGIDLEMTIYNKYFMVPEWINNMIVRKNKQTVTIRFDELEMGVIDRTGESYRKLVTDGSWPEHENNSTY